ncbi:MAG: efflux RND transporter periplasmic adaptor subunit [Candidatus Competibacteraceae bacterium]
MVQNACTRRPSRRDSPGLSRLASRYCWPDLHGALLCPRLAPRRLSDGSGGRLGWALFGLVLLFGLPACREQATPPGPAARLTPVVVSPVQTVTFKRAIDSVGVLAAKDEHRLSFKVGGVIEQIMVEAGDRVQRGQVLARLKPTEIDAQVHQAEEAYTKAKRDLERMQKLRDKGVVSVEQMQDAQTNESIASAALKTTLFNRSLADILAPVDGVVLEKLASVNEITNPGTPILVIAAEESGYVLRVGLIDRDVVRIRRGDSATVSFDAFPEKTFKATVSEVAAAADPRTGTFRTELRIEAGGQRLFTGLIGRARITPATTSSSSALAVPIEALLEANGSQAYVFTLEATTGAVRKRPVRVGDIHGALAVVEGLEPGDVVVKEGAAYLEDGARISIQQRLSDL